MYRLLQYYGRWQSVRGGIAGLPSWARLIVGVFAIPGILAILLSILAFLVSLLALLLLTVPVYRVLSALCGAGAVREGVVTRSDGFMPVADEVVIEDSADGTQVVESAEAQPRTPRRQIDVKIVE